MRKLAIVLALAAGCASTESQSRGTSGGTSAADTSEGSQTTAGTQRGTGQDPLMEPGPAVKGHAEDRTVSGQVSQVSGSSLVVQSDLGDSRTLQIAPETAISVDGLDASRSDLREGQSVRASYSNVEGRDVAVEIHAASSGAAPGSGAAGSTSPGTSTGTSPSTSPDTSTGTGSSSPDSSTGTGSSTPSDSSMPPNVLPGPDGASPPDGSGAPGGTGSPSGPGSSGSADEPTTVPR
jgi:hypothetical protein